MNLYDLNNSTCRRKRVGSCQGLFKLNNNEFLVCDGKEGIIWHYSLEESKLSKLIETPQFIRARYLSKSLQLAISLGNPYDLTENEVVMHSDSRRLRIYDLVDLSYREYPILPSFNLFEANVEGTIFLSRKAWVSRKTQVETYALEGGEFRRLNSGGLARGFEILSIIPERSMVIAVSHQGRKSILAGVKLWTNATT